MDALYSICRRELHRTLAPRFASGRPSAPRVRRWLDRYLRELGVLALAVTISACGGSGSGGGGGSAGGGGAAGGSGGGGGTAPTVVTLEVTPGSATVAPGGTAQYSVVARDAAGLVMATPAVTWLSATTAVGTITEGGLATGAAPGQTSITASAGSVTSPAAVLNVVQPMACDGIENVPRWTVKFEFLYSDTIRTSAGVDVHAGHYATVAATVELQGPAFQGKLNWTGPLAAGPDHLGAAPSHGAVTILEEFSDLVSDPTTVAHLFADQGGAPLPTPGIDGFRLEVDLPTCTFRFIVAPTTHTRLEKTEHAIKTLPGPDEGLRVFTQVTELGLVQRRVTPLGAWRTMGMGDFANVVEGFNAYSVGVNVPVDVDAYIPSGIFPQGAFFDPFSPAPRVSKADMYYEIRPQF